MSNDKETSSEQIDQSTDEGQVAEAQKESESTISAIEFPIVGIGASAGGLETFKRLFSDMPTDTGMAFVLVQHLDPHHESIMAELVGKTTKMPVTQVEDEMKIERDHVYMIPPNADLVIDGDRLRLTEPVKERGIRMPIDSFFRSLAEQCRERAICIVLSGTGSDGSLGLKAVKGVGGMAMAEDPEQAHYDGMPKAAVATGEVDFVLPVEEMPDRLVRYSQHPYIGGGAESALIERAPNEKLESILSVLRERTDYDFRSYKTGTLSRRIERRLGLNHIENLDQYLELLRSDKEEVGGLFRDLLIGVTAFFRDPEAWERLETKVLRPLIKSKRRGETVRVWTVGCSTGEEAYSLAMLLSELFSEENRAPKVQVFATDIDEEAVARARAGIYPESVGADLSKERIARFFDSEGNELKVKKFLREMVVFAPQNLIDDPPFSKLDLISCRNLLIYLNANVQGRVMPMFHFSLAREGYLFLGNSESIGKHGDLFEPISKEWKIFRKKAKVVDVASRPNAGKMRDKEGSAELTDRAKPRKKMMTELARSVLLDRFAPAAVLIDRKYKIYYFHGPTKKYLDYPSGEPSHDLTVLCDKQLSAKVQSAVHRAASSAERVSVIAKSVKRDGESVDVRISVDPIRGEGDTENYLVSFLDEIPRKQDTSAEGESTEDSDVIAQLEDELQTTREDLQTGIEELETSNEELKASNEEVMSMNEELQSTNEELETSREELQSLNEELTTVNSQLKDKIEELEATNNDLNNLLTSTDIATIFLDSNMRVRRFTPATSELIRLIPSDIGRPLSDIASKFTDELVIEGAKTVLDKLTPLEDEVSDDEGKAYIRRILPYRTHDNYIDGVVITFTDITELRKAADLVRVREKQQAAVAELGKMALGGASLQDLFSEACRTATNVLGFEYSKILDLQEGGKRFLLRAGVGWEKELIGVGHVDAGRDSQAGYTLEAHGPVIVDDLSEEKRFHGPPLLVDHGVVSGMSVIIGSEDSPWGVMGVHSTAHRNITVDDVNFLQSLANVLSTAIERRNAERALERSQERYRLVSDSLPVLISYCDSEKRYQFCNARYQDWFGMDKSAIIGSRIVDVIGEEAFAQVEPALDRALQGETLVVESELAYKKGRKRYVRVEYIPDKHGEVVSGVYVMVQDVTARHEAEEQLRVFSEELSKTVDERTEELRVLHDNVPAFFCYLDSDFRYRFVNKYYEEKFNEGRGTLIGKSIHETISPDSYEEVEPLLHSALSGTTVESEVVLDITKDGTRVVRARFEPRIESDEKVVGVLVLADDVTHERELQQAVLTAAEAENERIGRDLHDSICQELAGIGMLGKALAEKLRRQERGSIEEADQLVDQIVEVTQKSRLLARGLSPVALENRTLCEALEELSDNVGNLFPEVTCQVVDCAEEVDIDDAISTQLYFITREAVFNAAKHGEKSNIEIGVSLHGDFLAITVADDGGGRKESIEEGMGIRSMRFRARTFGGVFSIENRKDEKGLVVSCRLRIRED